MKIFLHITLEHDVITFHLPQGGLERLQILPRSSPKSSPYGLLFVFKCVDTLLTCGYIKKNISLKRQSNAISSANYGKPLVVSISGF